LPFSVQFACVQADPHSIVNGVTGGKPDEETCMTASMRAVNVSTGTQLAVKVSTGTELVALAAVATPRPVIKPGELLVEIMATAVNRSDVLSVRGLMPMTLFPRVPGRDFAGVVVEGPEEVVGARVWGAGGCELGFTRDGCHAQLLSVPVDGVAPMPESLSFDDAAAGALAYFTAHEALARAGFVAGATVLVTGAAGAVGTAVASLAAAGGARVIGVLKTDSAAKEAVGLDAAFSSDRPDLVEVIQAATDGRGVDVAVDTVGGALTSEVLKSLTPGGGACVISSVPGARIGFDVLEFYRADLRLIGLNTGRLTCSHAASVLRSLTAGFDSGALRVPRIASRHPLTDVATAYQEQFAGAGGRVLLNPQS